jgi:DNA repair protein SbcD/Mre11
VIARREGRLDLGAHLIPIADSAGVAGAHVLALPYPRPADLPMIAEGEGSAVVHGVRELYREAVSVAREQIGAAPLILTGHLHVAGGLESEGAERRILVGGEHAAPPDIFPDDVAYVALGHLHRPQGVGRETIRYSGALIPMSKTEIGYSHGVSLVTIDDTGAATLEHAPLTRSLQHLRLPAQGAMALGDIDAALAALSLDPQTPMDARPFVHLTVRVEGPAPSLKADVDAACEKYPVRLVSLAVERPQRVETAPAAQVRLSERAPLDLFREAFEATHNVPPTDAHLRFFDQLAGEE